MTTWRIKVSARAFKTLKALDTPVKRRIEASIDELATLPNPRATGKALQGRLAGYWRFCIGDYRIICQIKDEELVILVIEIGHRKDIYR
jgi:mRNA interferase RelE/StbE